MAVTTLKRKLRRKRQGQNTRVIKIKQLSAKPVIKNVDIEELKKNFDKSSFQLLKEIRKASEIVAFFIFPFCPVQPPSGCVFCPHLFQKATKSSLYEIPVAQSHPGSCTDN